MEQAAPRLAALPSEEPLISVRGLSKHFGGIAALDSVDLDFWPGEIHAIVGENGAGKSTLNKILTGVYWPDAGSVSVRGHPVRFRSPADAERHGIVAVYQETSLIPELSVASNVLLHHEPRRWGPIIDEKAQLRQCQQVLDDLTIAINPKSPVWSLSIAERQLIELAKAIARNAAFVIMDEPTAALASDDQERLFAILLDLRSRGRTVLYVSHRLEEIFRTADRVTVLRDGRLVTTRSRAETSRDELIRSMIGRDLLHHLYPKRMRAADLDAERLAVEDLSAQGRFSGISFSVGRGEVVGIAGLVGAGRTSLLRAIFGADRCDSGTIKLDGHVVDNSTPRAAVKNGFAMISEDRRRDSLALPINVVGNVTAVSLPSKGGLVGMRARWHQAKQAARAVALKAELTRPVADLSGGNQQKVALAKWLVKRPHVLLCDEPTRGIDVGAKAEIYRLLRDLAADGTAVLFASSELPEVLGFADRILVMREGRLVASFDHLLVDEETILRAASGVPMEGESSRV